MPKPAKKTARKSRSLTGAQDPLEQLLRRYIDDFAAANHAAHVVKTGLCVLGVGLRPLVDHLTFRTLSIEKRAREFLEYGYAYDARLGRMEHENGWTQVYRKAGYPSICIEQPDLNRRIAVGKHPVSHGKDWPKKGRHKKDGEIEHWVKLYGDKGPHHIAIQVDDLNQAVYYMEKQGVPFSAEQIGMQGSDWRQVFASPKIVKGEFCTVLELTERHRGFSSFLHPSCNGRRPAAGH